MEEIYDVVIVGCGMAGALAGLAALKENLSVCIVEKKRRKFIGKKVCGELLPQETMEWLRESLDIQIDYYPLKGLEICNLSEHTATRRSLSPYRLQIEEPLCTVDRWEFGQVLVDHLVKRGARLYRDNVKGPVVEDRVEGVETEHSRTYLGAVTIDCSGVFSVLGMGASTHSSIQSFGLAYKEDVILEDPLDLEYAMILIDKQVIPTGYVWCFPKSEYCLNTGVGGLGVNQLSLRKILHKNMKIHRTFTAKERTNTGFGVLPLGRPLPSFVYPGLLVSGDAAGQLNPVTGEGIAPALKSGFCAGMTAAQAVQRGDFSVAGMWKYNVECAKQYGIIHAPLLALKDFLLSLSNEDLTFLVENLITNEDLAELESDQADISWKRKLSIVVRCWKKPGLLLKLYSAVRKMDKIRALYQQYPETPEEFSSWNRTLSHLVS